MLFKLYCLPGVFFARLGYLFPGKGQLWASGRRRDSRLAHFLFATPFWLVLAFLVLGVIGGSHKSSRHVDLDGDRRSRVEETSRTGEKELPSPAKVEPTEALPPEAPQPSDERQSSAIPARAEADAIESTDEPALANVGSSENMIDPTEAPE